MNSLALLEKEFLGQSVKVTEKKFTYKGKDFVGYVLAETNPVIDRLRQAALKQGFNSIRVFTPMSAGTDDRNPGRVNVHVTLDVHNVWTISSMSLG